MIIINSKTIQAINDAADEQGDLDLPNRRMRPLRFLISETLPEHRLVFRPYLKVKDKIWEKGVVYLVLYDGAQFIKATIAKDTKAMEKRLHKQLISRTIIGRTLRVEDYRVHRFRGGEMIADIYLVIRQARLLVSSGIYEYLVAP